MSLDKVKITLILSFHSKAIQYEWLADKIDKTKFELHFIFLNPGETFIENHIRARSIKCDRVAYRSKWNVFSAIFKVWLILMKTRPHVVHCHLFDANIVGLTAGFLAGVRKRIYTRHHSSFHHMYFPKTVKWDKYANTLATHIVAISKNVREVLTQRENVLPSKITTIHHGFILDEIENVTIDQTRAIKEKYDYKNCYPVVGVVSRYIPWKGIEYIIEAFQKFQQLYPNSLLVLANASGYYKDEISKKLNCLNKNSYREIVFENDSAALFSSFDYFVHAPIDHEFEAFGQVYVEALSAGVPSVFTMSGVAPEFIINNENAIVVDYKNSQEIFEGLIKLHSNPDLRNKIIANGRKSVHERFAFDVFLNKLCNLYQN